MPTNNYQLKLNTHLFTGTLTALLFTCFAYSGRCQTFVHPGVLHKRSDLDRMKYMALQSNTEPYKTSYQKLKAESKAQWSYAVRGKTSFTELKREFSPSINRSEMESDCRAAYLNALMWYITNDPRHARKTIEILNAWTGLRKFSGNAVPLMAGLYGYLLVNAAEIIKHTYNGWSQPDQDAFNYMLTYRNGNDKTFLYSVYDFAARTWGNQEIEALKTMMAIGIYLDNDTIYKRALNYYKNLPPLAGDSPYPGGKYNRTSNTPNSGSTPYMDRYDITSTIDNTIPTNYFYNGTLQNYIFSNGQCQESHRDQAHAMLGLGALCEVSEMVYNQGEDLYGLLNDRLLLGLEYTSRYNIPSLGWNNPPFTPFWDRQNANYGKGITPDERGTYEEHAIFEMPVAHYQVRAKKAPSAFTYTKAARDSSIIKLGRYENSGFATDVPGWGGLTYHRENSFTGDPCSAGGNSFAVKKIPGTIEAEDFDFSPLDGEGRTYHDVSAGNNGSQYRTAEDVDIEVCTEGGYDVKSNDLGEWLTYSVYIPADGKYNLNIRYAATSSSGQIRFEFGGADKTGNVTLNSTSGGQTWATKTISGIILDAGMQIMKVYITGTAKAYNLNKFSFTSGNTAHATLNIPGTIDAEDFDNGGQNAAYYDNTDGNPGSARTTEDVDIVTISGSDYAVGSIIAGEWLKYTVNVNNNASYPGTYGMEINTSSPYSNKRIVVEMDGLIVDTILFNTTGSYSTYQSHKGADLTLTNGTHLIRLLFLDASFNVNYIRFTEKQSPVQNTALGTSARTIQAEDFDMGGEGIAYHETTTGNQGNKYRIEDDVDIQVCGDANGGYNAGWLIAGEWMEYTFTVSGAAAGNYHITSRVSSTSTAGRFRIYIDDEDVTGQLSVPNTGSYQSYADVTRNNIPITSGTHVMRFKVDVAGFNVNYFAFSAKVSGLRQVLTVADSSINIQEDRIMKVSVFPNPASEQVTVSIPQTVTGLASVTLIDLNGKVVRSIYTANHKANIDVSGLKASVYIIIVKANGLNETVKFIKQ